MRQPANWAPGYPHLYRKGLSVDTLTVAPSAEPAVANPYWWQHAGSVAMQGLPDEIARLRGQFPVAAQQTEVPHD